MSIENVDEGMETHCGCQLPWRSFKSRKTFKTIQYFANVKFALLLLCIGMMLHDAVSNGLYGMSLSTIEHRFQLKSTDMGVIAGCQDIGVLVGMGFIIIFGENRHKPMWIAQGITLVGISCFIYSIPHFIAPKYIPTKELQARLCQNEISDGCSYSNIQGFKYIFAIAMLLFGLGVVPLNTHGIVYIDENSSKAKSSLYSSLLFFSGGVGPMVGFVGGGAALELYTYIGQEPNGVTSSSADWIGAWWLGFVICGIVALVVSFLIYMLPKSMPGSEELRNNRNDEMHVNKNIDDVKLQEIADSVYKSMKYLLQNKCLMLCITGNALNFAFIYGFNTFGAKYFESQLGLKPFIAALLYGICSILAAAVSQVISGAIISKYNLNVQQIIKFMLICSILSACCSFGLLIHCPDISFAGATLPYHGSNETGLTSPCNANCTCSTDIYEPVCDSDGITYFSPCFAGCSGIHDNGSFSECSCIYSFKNNSIIETESGICDQSYCTLIPLFTLCIFFAFFTSLMTYTPSIQVTLRCVPFNLRTRAISLNKMFSCLFGTIPGRVFTGLVVDLACAAWQTDCGSQGSCVVYNKWEMARNMAIILLTETWCMVGVYVIMLYVYEPFKNESDFNENYPMEENENPLSTSEPLLIS